MFTPKKLPVDDSEVFSTPLQKLLSPLRTEQLPVTRYQQRLLVTRNDHNEINEISKPQQIYSISNNKPVDLFSKTLKKTEAESEKDPIIYYKPPSVSSRYGFKNLLPPKTQGKSKHPIIAQPEPVFEATKQSEDSDDDTEYPTGQWTSPVVQTALSRQVNKEAIFRRVVANVLCYLVLKLVVASFKYIYIFYEIQQKNQVSKLMEHLKENDTTLWQWYLNTGVICISGLFLVNIAVGVVQLARPHDQCWDLPLTMNQRELLGLQKASEDLDESELVFKQRTFEAKVDSRSQKLPKYSLVNHGSLYTKKREVSAEPSIELSDVALAPGLYTRSAHRAEPKPRNRELERKFAEKYNIDFGFDK